MDALLLRRFEDEMLYRDAEGGRAAPGKSTVTSRMSPGLVLRVADPETARALGESLRGRDRNGVADGAERAVADAAGSSGAPLRGDLRDRFERSLGADLSGVRVHTGESSQVASAAVGAKAYTVGNDIHFGQGQYQPDDPFGMHLIAHEVAHTVQQAGGATERQHKLEVSAPGDAAEVEADRAADAMVAGEAFAVGGSGGELARKEAAPAPAAGDKPANPDDKMGSKEKKFPFGMDGITLGLGPGSKLKIPWAADQMSLSKEWTAEEKLEKEIVNQKFPVQAGALPAGIQVSAEASANLTASAKASVTGTIDELPPPHVDATGATVTVSGSAGLSAGVEGLLGLGAYLGIPPLNIGAEGYVTLSAAVSAEAAITGQAKYVPATGWSGTVTFSVPLEAKITGTGGIRLIYASLIKNGEIQRFQLKSVDIATARVECNIVYDVGSGTTTESTDAKWEMMPLNFPAETLSREEAAQWQQREADDRDGGSGSGAGVDPALVGPEEGTFEEQCEGEDASVMCGSGEE